MPAVPGGGGIPINPSPSNLGSGQTGATTAFPFVPPPASAYGAPSTPPPMFGGAVVMPTIEPASPATVNSVALSLNVSASGPDGIAVVYGTQKVEGRVINVGYDLYNRWRDYLIGVAAGPIHGVTLYSTPAAVWQTAPLGWAEYLGLSSQTPYPYTAYVQARQYLQYWDGTTWLPYDPPIEDPGKWEFVVAGLKILDTRTSVTALSTNPAMCLRDLLINTTYGAGIDAALLDEQSFKDAADICDVLVDGNKRYELNIAILAEGDIWTWIETICTHFAAQLYVQDGLFRLWVDGVTSDSGVLFDSSNSREWELTETELTERPSRVIVEYIRAANDYAADKATAEVTGASVAGETREAGYKLEGITTAHHAQRVAEYILKVQALAPLRVTFTASPLAARLSRGTRFKLTFPNGVTAQDFLLVDSQPVENGEYEITAREYDAAVYTAGATVTPPPVPTPGPDPAATPPDVTVSAWGLHTVRTPGTAATYIEEASYIRLKYTLPADYVFGSCLVVRGDWSLTSYGAEPAWDDLIDEIIVPLTGNLPPSGGFLYLYWPVAIKNENWTYYDSGVVQSHVINVNAYKVMVRMRSIAGNLSTGVKTYSGTPLSSTSNYNDLGSTNQNTKELRLVETGGGTNYWGLKSPAALSADRTLTMPDAAPVAGRLAIDASGNITFFAEYAFAANKNGTDQTAIADTTWTKVTFTTEEFDVNGAYDAANSKFVAPVAGKYQFHTHLTMAPAASATDTLLRVSLYKNGSEVKSGPNQGNRDANGLGAQVSALLDLALNDYIEVYVYHTRGSDGTVYGVTSLASFSGFRVA